MNLWFVLAINSITLGGLLFLLSAGFSLIFGLMRIPNLTHGSFFMLGAYLSTSLIARGLDFWTAAVVGGLGVAVPKYRLAVSLVAVAFAAGLWALLERTRLGAMIRAGVDDPSMARVVGIRVSRLFTIVFCLGAWLAGFAGVIGGPILSVYPCLDAEMLPLALVVVILGGSGSLLGSLVGSLIVGFLYNFGQAMFPELAYVVLFLHLLIVLVVRPHCLFGLPAV